MKKKMKVKVPWSDPLYGKTNRLEILRALAASILQLQAETDNPRTLMDLVEGKSTMDLEVEGDQIYFIDEHFMNHESIKRDFMPVLHILLDQMEGFEVPGVDFKTSD